MSAADAAALEILKADGGVIVGYSLDQLRKDFAQATITTATPWAPQPIEFRGVALKDILAKNQISPVADITLTAIDGFSTTLSAQDVQRYSPILAIERQCSPTELQTSVCANGMIELTIEEKGPLFTVWPLTELVRDGADARNNIWVWYATKIQPAK